MGSVFSSALLLPAVAMAVFGFVVPRLWARVLPEGVAPLMLNAFLSTLVLFLLSAALFLVLYAGQGVRLTDALSLGVVSAIVYFSRLGLASAIIWGPILVLSVAGLPRKWVKETW